MKHSYRDTLSQGFPEVWFVYLEVPEAVIADRLAHRSNHYMPKSLLPTQLRTLEVPGGDEQVIRVAANGDIDRTVQAVIDALPTR